MYKQFVAYSYNRILSNKKEKTTEILNSMGESHENYAKSRHKREHPV